MPGRTESEYVDLLRILDAAANRAREGLRVLEDHVRFVLDDAHLTGLLKGCRHALSGALKGIPLEEFVSARDTLQDVGTGLMTRGERERAVSTDVLLANFKRVQEALRTLEEFSKESRVQSPESRERQSPPVTTAGSHGPLPVGLDPSGLSTLDSGLFRQLRYRLYTLEKAVFLTESNQHRLAGRCLYLLVTESHCRRGWETVVKNSLASGVGMIQLREKTMPDRQLVERGKRVREWSRQAGALMIVNDRPDVAVLTEADGVHIGQEELTVRQARRILGPRRLIGVSTHSIEQARQAVLDGADYLGVGPVFPSRTKTFEDFAGLELVHQVATEIALPWFAIGGVDADNLEQVIKAGASRMAVSGAICSAEDPGAVAAELSARLREAFPERAQPS